MKSSPKARNSTASRGASGKRVAKRTGAVSQLDLLRMRVEAAEETWKAAKELAGKAKRRRKLAKLLAKRAKKDARTAKANLDELRQVLTLAQARATRSAVSAAPKPAAAPKAPTPRRAPIKRVSKKPAPADKAAMAAMFLPPAEPANNEASSGSLENNSVSNAPTPDNHYENRTSGPAEPQKI